jgi:tight adherence protein C
MSRALALAVLAAVAAAGGLVELAELRVERSRRHGAWRRHRAASAWAALASGLVRVGGRLGAPAPRRDLAVRIAAAGSPLGLGPGDVAAVKAAAGVIALVVGFPLALSLPGRLPLVAVPALPLAGFLGPDLVLARLARRRARAMAEELPDLLDLVRVSVEAGLPVGRALAEVGHGNRGELAAEWRTAGAEIALGVPRTRVLAEMAARCPAPAVAALVAALQRAERHGAPLSDTLAAQAHEARAARARRVRENAARAAPKIQLAVALLLVPSVLLMVAAALVASLAR